MRWRAHLVLSALVVAFFVYRYDDLRVGWHRRRLASAEPHGRRAAVRELLALGPRGLATLEAVAFSRETALPGTHETVVRQEVLELLGVRSIEAVWPRLFLEARGLDREALLRRFSWEPPQTAGILDAAFEAALHDPDPDFAVLALEIVRRGTRPCDRPVLLRAAARASDHGEVRRVAIEALSGWVDDPGSRSVIREAYHDPDEEVRVAAAWLLARLVHDGQALGVLVRALRPTPGSFATRTRRRAAEGLAALRDRRALAALRAGRGVLALEARWGEAERRLAGTLDDAIFDLAPR